MKLLKSLAMYCIIIIFIMSLTSSFELGNSKKSIGQLSIKRDKMYEVFFSSANANGISLEEETATDKPSVTPTPTVDTSKEYQLGDSGEEVFKYQKFLYYLDYIENVPEGNFGDTMKLAVEAYQTAKNLEVTGKLDSKTQQYLLSEQIDYKKGKTGDEIKEFQLILYYLDYLQSYPDGQYGSETEASVKRYQENKSLEATGVIDNKTNTSLNAEQIIYKAGKKGDAIIEYQDILITLGYLSGTPDGQFGTNSVNAVKQYQEKNNLDLTGALDIPTQTSLKKPIEEQEEF